MHNSWAGPTESLCSLSKLLLTALDDAAMGIPVAHAKQRMCVQACTRERTCMHTPPFKREWIGMNTLS